MKAVILAGGKGTRIVEETNFKPKPMIEIGGMPIIWHIMKGFSIYGIDEFVICAGYMQHVLKQWFVDYFTNSSDVTFDYRGGKEEITIDKTRAEQWKVSIVDTGIDTMTGGRIKRIQKYIGNEAFLMTYGDAVCDVNVTDLIEFHKKQHKIATLTAVLQDQSKGVLNIGGNCAVQSFREKNIYDATPINAGYMVLEPEIFDYIEGDETIFEQEPLERLAKEGELMSYMHKGFWQCMDNVREKWMLEKMLEEHNAPWKKWE